MADTTERGRSLATSQANNHIRHGTSASPHPPLPAASSYNNLTSSNANPLYNGLTTQSASGDFDANFSPANFNPQAQYSLGPSYTEFQEQQQQPNALYPDNQYNTSHDLRHASLEGKVEDPTFSNIGYDQNTFDGTSLDPSLLNDLDPSTLDLIQAQEEINNTSLGNMATTLQAHSPAAPHLHPDFTTSSRRQSASPSPHASPGFQQTGFQTMTRERNTSATLDPSSAMFPPGQSEWSNMGAYRSHHRSQSDQLSDISSNHNSPYIASLDTFDSANAHSSPLLTTIGDGSFPDGLPTLQSFSLADGQIMTQGGFPSHTPAHSPGHSPNLMPQSQQALPQFTANNYGLGPSLNGPFGRPNGLDIYNTVSGQEAFPDYNTPSPGQADQMSPPEFKIDYAPPSRTLTVEMGQDASEGALSPPATMSRKRSKSDSHAGSRGSTPALVGRGRSPSLQPSDAFEAYTASRSQSPANRDRSLSASSADGNRGRASSASATEQRRTILDLADPSRSPSNGDPRGRQQKHPATFQCTICPKRFTRAYNLRSHLRTHTDERPFVCTVCGKAFARQHDRKRHEGLHSGEKKFVCRGNLTNGAQWGCGRRFARADALGRHFRSEAGRVCIKPLLEEEAAERQKQWMEAQQQQQQHAAHVHQQQQAMLAPQMDMMNNFLPAALIAQYPALAGIDWNAVPAGNPPNEDDYSGRSSFDASSGNEYYDDLSEGEIPSGYGEEALLNGAGGMPGQGAYFG